MTKIMPVNFLIFLNLVMVVSHFPLQFSADLYIVMVLVPCTMKMSNKFSPYEKMGKFPLLATFLKLDKKTHTTIFCIHAVLFQKVCQYVKLSQNLKMSMLSKAKDFQTYLIYDI